ncbi:MAG: thiazole synthase [Candidatus Omnitrophica bacterium]|nr:thiazole synthase [Candidatus Omnitrophota bacterium]
MLTIGRYSFRSRLIMGTGKYPTPQIMQEALEASQTELVTVALRRVDLKNRQADPVLGFLDPKRYTILPNTAGCTTAEEAIRTARLSRASGGSDLIKLEVIGDPKTLMPDTLGLLEATRALVQEGFTVLPYTNDDPVMARRLEEAGAACVMPLAAPIGSGQGVLNPLNIQFILEAVKIPVIVDAGVGTASDAAVAMELGVEGVLMNTGVAGARDPVRMARGMRLAVEAGRLAYLAGRIPKKTYASPSSPQTGKVGSR